MLNLSQHSITKVPIPPMATLKQYLMAIQLLSPFTLSMLLTFKPRIQRHLKITKNPEWKTKPHSTKRKQHKKKPLTKQKISPKKKKPHIIDNQIINHHTPNLQRTLGRHWQTILGQPTKKPGIHITNIC